MIAAVPFTYDATRHSYAIDGRPVPSVTQLLKLGGLVDDSFYTEESRRRGSWVHEVCANYDLGVDVVSQIAESKWKGYVLAYLAACARLQPSWEAIEEAEVHPSLRFGGRPDRLGQVLGRPTVCELKTGPKVRPVRREQDSDGETYFVNIGCEPHRIQTALQAWLVAWRLGVKPADLQRLVIYLQLSGKYVVDVHSDARDLDVAADLIARFCR